MGEAQVALPLVRTIYAIAIMNCLIRPNAVLPGHARGEDSYLVDHTA